MQKACTCVPKDHTPRISFQNVTSVEEGIASEPCKRFLVLKKREQYVAITGPRIASFRKAPDTIKF